jgi:hypothetical protein
VGRRWTWVAWSMLAVFIVIMVLWIILGVANGGFVLIAPVAMPLAYTAFMVVGALIMAHRPGNPMGWLFSALGLLAALTFLAMEYAAFAYYTRPGPWPGAIVAAWWSAWAPYPLFGLTVTFTLLLFPTGRLLSPRWRVVAWLAAIDLAGRTAAAALGPSLPTVGLPNPIAVAGMPDLQQPAVGAALSLPGYALVLAACASLVLRFRRSQGVERQQLKWFLYAAVLMAATTPVVALLGPRLTPTTINLTIGLLYALFPIAAGIAILRYRLYDIDRLINRTLVYGLLTALLAGVYGGAVLVLGQVFGGVGEDPPSWVVAGATLAVAALFQPARRRIQAVVDRRFNRRKFNAAKTVEAFSTRLRDEIDLDALSAELLAVVDQTIQPTRASLWLRQADQRSPRTGT